MRYDKVRRILRAKHGSQILKFLTPGNIPLSTISLRMLFLPFEEQILYGMSLLLSGITSPTLTNPNSLITGSTIPIPKTPSNIPNIEMPGIPLVDPTNIKLPGSNKPSFTKVLGAMGKLTVRNIGNAFKNINANQLLDKGFDILGNSFNNVENNEGTNTAFAVGDTISNGLMSVNPVLGMYAKGAMTLLKGVNSLGASTTLDFAVDQSTVEQVGSSYGGSSNLIANAASKAGKTYGLFSTGSRKKADRQINEARRQQNIMTNIAGQASDLRAMINDLNYTNYLFNLNGGYDQRYMRAAKSGMKIQDRINFVKLKRVVNNIINLDTKEIEWEPVIEDIVEEFKEGGIIEKISDWEPIIDDIIDYWEPVIDNIEVYKEGGSIKEELETPEIEETNQKNLIPEGALHKNKHHMEHTEGLTQKGIPVIDNDGEQQAEIELDEIIFTLEVTKKLEELYKEGTDEAAIEAGKLLVKEILFNTDDRTGLISKCEKGGKL